MTKVQREAAYSIGIVVAADVEADHALVPGREHIVLTLFIDTTAILADVKVAPTTLNESSNTLLPDLNHTR
jgi:hypothetical protein